ncbi:uncharacterized protein EI90DRAFT_3052367 [Cantharellus anzutake]|uniref:uncharacterized protein n=1 Tax=Cantharellus anzutake TaxID=1750568 RepID=UPI001907A212|nr:uncharacterized protein EI90DRAFT_3052367 [Cantharellus anzutake]KAF8333556.1 hypothetical protein EI90DRAFT_3052367 [Cantharellus anzutake]
MLSGDQSPIIPTHHMLPINDRGDYTASTSSSGLKGNGFNSLPDNSVNVALVRSSQAASSFPSPPSTALPVPFRRVRTYSTPRPFHTNTQHKQEAPVLQATSSEFRPNPSGSKLPSRIPKPTPRARSSSRREPNPSSYGNPLPHDPSSPTTYNGSAPHNILGTISSNLKTNGSACHSDPEDDSYEASQQDDKPHQYEHWYRGEGREGGGRNGGRGEILAGTKEMLEIAMGGHPPGSYTRRRSWRTRYDPPVNSPDAESFWSSSRPGSSVHKWEDEYMLDEPPLTDLEADDGATINDCEPTLGTQSPTQPNRAVTPPKVTPPVSAPPASAVTLRSNSNLQTENVPRSNAALTHKSANIPSAVVAKKRPRKQSISRPKNLMSRSRSAHEVPSHDGPLADAIPPQPDTHIIPPSGNWDDVILPTVAKKLRLARGQNSDDFTTFIATPGSQADVIQKLAVVTHEGIHPEAANHNSPHHVGNVELAELGMRARNRRSVQRTSLAPPPTSPPDTRTSLPKSFPGSPMTMNPPLPLPESQEGKQFREHDDIHSSGCCRCVIM